MIRPLCLLAAFFAIAGCSQPAHTMASEQVEPEKKTRAAELISCLKGGESEVRAGLTDMKLTDDITNQLAAIGGNASPEILAVICTRSESTAIRMTLMDAMYRMGDKRAVPYFIYLLNDDSESVREKARFVLENFTGAEFHLLTAAPPGPLRNQGIAEWKRWWLDHKEEYGQKYGRLSYDSSWDSIPPTE